MRDLAQAFVEGKFDRFRKHFHALDGRRHGDRRNIVILWHAIEKGLHHQRDRMFGRPGGRCFVRGAQRLVKEVRSALPTAPKARK